MLHQWLNTKSPFWFICLFAFRKKDDSFSFYFILGLIQPHLFSLSVLCHLTGTTDSWEGTCFLRSGCCSSANSGTRRIKEHRLFHSLPPPLFLWHGVLSLVSANKHWVFINPSSLFPSLIIVISSWECLLLEQLEYETCILFSLKSYCPVS